VHASVDVDVGRVVIVYICADPFRGTLPRVIFAAMEYVVMPPGAAVNTNDVATVLAAGVVRLAVVDNAKSDHRAL